MADWLNLQNVLITISIFSTLLYIIKLIIFIFIGGDAEVDSDFDAMTETDVSFSFLSVQSILAFFMGMGWSGLAALVQFNLSAKISLAIALLVGFIFMYITAYLMYSVKKLNQNVKEDITTLIGKTGKAYTAIAPHAEGQIQIDINNKLSIFAAINESDEHIESFSQIKVTRVENNQIYIIKGV
ncbi:NfeD family protein [bacterium]|nr:NfeD family protein [bacterium]